MVLWSDLDSGTCRAPRQSRRPFALEFHFSLNFHAFPISPCWCAATRWFASQQVLPLTPERHPRGSSPSHPIGRWKFPPCDLWSKFESNRIVASSLHLFINDRFWNFPALLTRLRRPEHAFPVTLSSPGPLRRVSTLSQP